MPLINQCDTKTGLRGWINTRSRLIEIFINLFRPYTLLFLPILFQSQAASALDLDVRSSPYNQLDFSLSISILETELFDANTSSRIKFRRIGINSYDVPADGVHFGGHLGYAYSSQDRIEATRGLDLNGYYLGLGARVPLIEQQAFQAQCILDYIYQSVNGAGTEQTVRLYWHEYQAGLKLSTAIDRIELAAGLYFKKIDATQVASGNIQETLFLANNDKTQAIFGLRYFLSRDERVGVQISSGTTQGLDFLFQKLF